MSRKDRKFNRFFRQKLGDLQKKKKKKKRSSPKFRVIFRPKSKIQTFFPPKIKWSPKKKGLRQNSEWFFGRNPKFKRFFRPKSSDLQKKKKKKKGLRQNSRRFFFQNFASSNVSGGALFAWGSYFQFFTENRPQKHKKHAILHTSQDNGGGSSPPRPPPPWLRYWF